MGDLMLTLYIFNCTELGLSVVDWEPVTPRDIKPNKSDVVRVDIKPREVMHILPSLNSYQTIVKIIC